ncbi:hypothetical protein UO65_1548 [Actinokineospora spheciospongiae]|uniref:Uncharacterized protein n=1 Tax=Actinokineospora spheciospongiae TaxID=909613 RepID=W7IS22_9PSEU|nr:hypothetical protein UO65_1548 [Actinokineospora spheciospongiae]
MEGHRAAALRVPRGLGFRCRSRGGAQAAGGVADVLGNTAHDGGLLLTGRRATGGNADLRDGEPVWVRPRRGGEAGEHAPHPHPSEAPPVSGNPPVHMVGGGPHWADRSS